MAVHSSVSWFSPLLALSLYKNIDNCSCNLPLVVNLASQNQKGPTGKLLRDFA